MDKSIMKIVITVIIIYMTLLVGGVCLLMHGGKLTIESMRESKQINQYKENGNGRGGSGNENPFSLSPVDQK